MTDTRKGFAKIAAGSTSVHVSYATINAYPMILATPEGDAGSWWIAGQSDVGFDIVLGAAQSHDVTFTWRVEPTPDGTVVWNSDNTNTLIDPLSGQPVPQAPTGGTSGTSTTSTP